MDIAPHERWRSSPASPTTKEFPVPKSRSSRTHAHASGAAGQSKRPRQTGNAGATGHDSKQQRSADATTSTHNKRRGGAPVAQDESTPRRAPSDYDPEGATVESGGGKERRGGRSDDSTDEETGARSRRPGGTGDASFGNDDEGPEGPAR
jgi:hypothetical protein